MNDMNVLSTAISPAYQKFFDKLAEPNIKETKDWKEIDLLKYFCERYKDYYQINYTFKLNGIPSKCYEIYQFRKLAMMLTADPQILKNYIDWIFQTKVIERKRRITALGYITNTDIVNEFKFKKLLNKIRIERTTQLPENCINAIKTIDDSVLTYGDLAFVKGYVQNNNLAEEKFKLILAEIEKIGFDLNSLDQIS